MAKKLFQTPTGMHDILPQEQPLWRKTMNILEDIAIFYGFQRIDMPILEDSELFEKGTGQMTDIVQKEMFSLKTKGGDMLTLRPEGTPPAVRAYLQHGMASWSSPVKLYYSGPMFRHERPQAGRFRQFHQFGVEVIGEMDPILDAQVIQLIYVALQALKLGEVTIQVNSIGDPQCRARYKKVLKDYYRNKVKQLCVDCRARYKTSPLRLLDCKEEKCQRVRSHAPHILDYLCEECHNHFRRVLEFLDSSGFPYLLNPYLVRGLDYYTKTVFEMFPGGAAEADMTNAMASGGRYDGLVKVLGGSDTPAVGGAIGIERALALLRERGGIAPKVERPRIFIAQLGDLAKKESMRLIEEFRAAKIPISEALGKESMKSQLTVADRLDVNYALILGQQEVYENNIIIREMESGIQETVPLPRAVEEMKKRLRRKKKKS